MAETGRRAVVDIVFEIAEDVGVAEIEDVRVAEGGADRAEALLDVVMKDAVVAELGRRPGPARLLSLKTVSRHAAPQASCALPVPNAVSTSPVRSIHHRSHRRTENCTEPCSRAGTQRTTAASFRNSMRCRTRRQPTSNPLRRTPRRTTLG
jgi:hypothetical protein